MVTWYDLFLTPLVEHRLGEKVTDRLRNLVRKNSKIIQDIERRISLVHGDFRPTNLLYHQGKINCVLDWEFAMAGHSIADIGQLFRRSGQFSLSCKREFVRVYNERAMNKLSVHWEAAGKLRDLVNLLQMLGADEEMPVKYRDLCNLIEQTVINLEQRLN
jgi:aminoglycoside phosphotransferase (APT) family kinase protein